MAGKRPEHRPRTGYYHVVRYTFAIVITCRPTPSDNTDKLDAFRTTFVVTRARFRVIVSADRRGLIRISRTEGGDRRNNER